MRGDWPGLRRRKARSQTGNRVPFVITDPCRGRFYIGPACGGAGFPGRDKSRPYEQILCFGANGMAAATRADVGRDAPIPPNPAAARTFRF